METQAIRKPDRNKKEIAFEKQLKVLANLTREEFADMKKNKWYAIAKGYQLLVNPQETIAFTKLLMRLYQCNCKKLLKNSEFIIAFSQMCYYTDKFINDIETWERKSQYADKQFQSILRHLFAKYEMPLFFDNVWFKDLALHQIWYIDVAQGKNIRKCDRLPIEMSKKMSFYFMQAPAKLGVEEAMRYAQLMICGGDDFLAKQIIQCNLDSQVRMAKGFWESMILFLSHNNRLPNEKIKQVFDYLANVRHDEPNFSFKGRTVASILKLSNEWHKQFEDEEEAERKAVKAPLITWEKSKFGNDYYNFRGGGRKVRYDIIELLNSEQLSVEGTRMRHCVGTYVNACKSGGTAIFSIRAGLKRLATVEVRVGAKRVVQAKAACNQAIDVTAYSLLRKWAKANDLKIDEEL